MIVKGYPSVIRGIVSAPQSKSIAIRLLFLSLATSIKLRNLQKSEDIQDAINAIKLLGVKEVNINRFQALDIPQSVKGSVYIKASGTTLRFLLAFLAVIGGEVTIKLGPSLKKRPIMDFVEAVKGQIYVKQEDDMIFLKGKLKGNYVKIRGTESSQYISGFILAFTTGEGGTIELLDKPTSRSFIYLTADVVNSLGGDVKIEDDKYVFVKGKQLVSYDDAIPGDYALSSFYAISAVTTKGNIVITGLPKPPDYFGDHSILEILKQIGVASYYDQGRWIVKGEPQLTTKVEVDIWDAPDLAMSVASLAPSVKEIIIKNIRNLRIKESDRIYGISKTLTSFGFDVNVKENELIIRNKYSMKASIVDCNNDHRIAMMSTPIMLKSGGEIINAECVNKSNPYFWNDISSLNGRIELID